MIRQTPRVPRRLGDFSGASFLHEVFLAELAYECAWFELAWDEMYKARDEGDARVLADPLRDNLKVWSYVDRMLTHIVRINRLLNPDPRAGPKESEDSRRWRVEFAEWIGDRVLTDLALDPDSLQARNGSEHANEYLHDFIAKYGAPRGGRNPRFAKFSIGVMGDSGRPEGAPIPIRSFNYTDGVCVVFGRPINLLRMCERVKGLRSQLPPAPVATELWRGDRRLSGPPE